MASDDLSIGVSGLLTAQKALQTIGHNIVNASTEGYSRQEVSLTTQTPTILSFGPIGMGVTLEQIIRTKDEMLETQIRNNNALQGNAEMQADSLRNLELFLNELSETGLSIAVEGFFKSLQELSIDPEQASSRNQLLQDGINMVNIFNFLDEQIKQVQFQTGQKIISRVNEVNTLTSGIANLNREIATIELGGQGNANDARDKRDNLVNRLSKLADIRVIDNNNGTINVILGGALVVDRIQDVQLETFTTGPGTIGVSGSSSINGGELKGLLDMQDVAVPKYIGKLDSLAAGIIQEINNIHSEGVGLNGGFTSLISTNAVNNSTTQLSSSTATTGLPFATTAGNLYVNVTDTSTGTTIKTNLTINAADILTDVRNTINGVANITASIATGSDGDILTISAGSGYTFDFSKDLAFDSAVNTIGGGTSAVTLSGYYNGSDNDSFILDATTPGTIGTGSTTITVTDGSVTLAVLDVGSSYTPGDVLQIADGVSVSFSSGTVLNASTRSFDVVNDPDTSNVLTALGLNTFFKGNNASTIDVTQFIKDDVSRIAAASSGSPGDNTNVLRLADLQSKLTMSNTTTTFSGFLESTIAELGLETRQRLSESENFNTIGVSLGNRRQEVSGVSIEEEMVNLIRFQQAFQASAKFISAIEELNTALMGMKR